jgi:hypothetical protein
MEIKKVLLSFKPKEIIVPLFKVEKEIILKALVDYEDRYYMSEGKKWQKTINKLINIFKENEKL